MRFAAGALISVSAFAIAATPAEAHHYRHYRHYAITGIRHIHVAHAARHWAAAIPASPAFSALVVDANTGRTLYSVAEDAPRHPASITKVMTLYLLFEQLDKGAMTLQTRIPISEHAAAQEPSKLGVEPGETISVEDAIKAVVTRSANDVAVAIAEAIGRDESTFAEMMTRKAHALGMSSTVYRNASGLPNDEQITTARDLTILARSLEERFPRYFKYFSTHEFEYAGEVIGNHNHLLGRVDGVDGIKTGYTRASGFNLLDVRASRRPLATRRGHGRAHRRRARPDHGKPDRGPYRRRLRLRIPPRWSPTRPATSSRSAQRVQEPISPQPAAVAASRALAGSIGLAQRCRGRQLRREGDACAATRRSRPRPSTSAAVKPPAKALPAKQSSADAARPEREHANSDGSKGPDRRPSKGQKIAQASLAAPIPPAKPNARRRARRLRTRLSRRGRPPEADDGDPAVTRKGWIIQIGATDDAAKASALLAKARERDPKALAAAKPSPKKCRKATTHSIAPGSPASIRLPPSLPAAPSNATDSPASPPTTDAGTFDPRSSILCPERLSLVVASEHPWPD